MKGRIKMLDSMEKIVNLCKARGYIYPGSEIYGGLSNTWDYGPLVVEFKNNVKNASTEAVGVVGYGKYKDGSIQSLKIFI